MIPKQRILVADDEPGVRQLLDVLLTEQGYDVQTAVNGDQLIRLAQVSVPELVLVDLMMPGVDGFEAIRQLRNDTRTAHVPAIILTARGNPVDVVSGFENGADDYITKPFNIPELLARIKRQLQRAAQIPVLNPLTGLPGNILLAEEIKFRMRQPEPFALLYIDLNNFKIFNDQYGFARGDRMIKLLAEVLRTSVAACGEGSEFIGHIGGDDFAVLAGANRNEEICAAIIRSFDQQAELLYDASDLERGYLEGVDRQGIPRSFPMISVSIGVATNRHRAFTDYEEVGRVAADMKHFAKQQPNSSFAVDIRTGLDAPNADRRGRQVPTVLLFSADPELLLQLHGQLDAAGLRSVEAQTVPQVHALLAHNLAPSLVIADARLGWMLHEFVQTTRGELSAVPLALVAGLAPADLDSHRAYTTLGLPLEPERVRELVQRES